MSLDNFDFGAFVKKWWLLGVVLFVIIITLSVMSNTKTKNREFEIQASAQYAACQSNLSTTMVAFNDKFGIFNFELAGIQDFVTEVIAGRYDNRDAAGLSTGQVDTNMLFSAVMEQYPNTEGITDFAREFSVWAGARRESFDQCQVQLISVLAAMDTFNSGLFQEGFSAAMGFPDKYLKVNVGEMTFRGEDARAKMDQLILYKGALAAYQNNDLPDQAIPTRIAP